MGSSVIREFCFFAVGDGNHSLATAKSVWEELKAQVGPDHPARYALVEIENLYDEGLEFEPIHRVVFNVQSDLVADLKAWFGERLTLQPYADEDEMVEQVHRLPVSRGASFRYYLRARQLAGKHPAPRFKSACG